MKRMAPLAVGPSSPSRPEQLGTPFVLLLVYLVMEYARPANPMGIPLVISVILFLNWLSLRVKRWRPQLVCFFLFVGSAAIMAPFALNTFAVYNGTRGLAVQLLCICVPITHYVSSIRKVRIFVGFWIAILVYVTFYAIGHSGVGPGGHIGDENDVALALDMAIPFTLAVAWTSRTKRGRMLGIGAFWLMVAGVTFTLSRGGFLGLVAVLLYCFGVVLRRPAWSVVFIAALVFGAYLAPANYWDEIASIAVEAKGGTGGTGDLRREYWVVARSMFYANPLLGVGLENFRWNVDRYTPPELAERAGRSYAGNVTHSVYFTILAETGLVGAVLFTLLVWYTVRDTGSVLRLVRERKPPLEGTMLDSAVGVDLEAAWLFAHAIRAALAGYLVAGAFLSVFTYPHFWVLVALTVALLEATLARRQEGAVVETVPTTGPQGGPRPRLPADDRRVLRERSA